MNSERRKAIIEYVKSQADFLAQNSEALDIYDGNLRPHIDAILRSSLSLTYYNAIKDRILPINILQRYVNKVSTTYSKPPQRECDDVAHKEFVEFYEEAFSINNSGMIADCYSNLFKGFAWEPYVDKDGKPQMRELAFDRFLVMSDSMVSPEEETVFIKLMGQKSADKDSLLLHVYTDTEFDAFYMNGNSADEYLIDNGGYNLYGCIPFIYGKRQKNRLIPLQDTDILSISKAISVMLTDAAGAQMFQCFSILYGIDVSSENMTMSPNAFWSIKSDRDSEHKTASIGSVKPEADTQKVMDFVTNIFILWLETKGIRTGSMGSVQGGNVASGISKIIDEMDAYEVKKKSMVWFKKDEEELWNKKLPLIHNYWIKSGMVDAAKVPPMITGEVLVKVEFETPTPMLSRAEELANIKTELDMGTMSMEVAVKTLHPDYDDDMVAEIVQAQSAVQDLLAKATKDVMDQKGNTAP